jgi:uncharacterized protein (DUF302 family)
MMGLPTRSLFTTAVLAGLIAGGSAGCSDTELPDDQRLERNDSLFNQVAKNVARSGMLEDLVDIDHARLGREAGSGMPPARVLIFSNPWLESALIQQNPLTAIDLPLRILAYESLSDGTNELIYNDFDYLLSRYRLDDDTEVRDMYTDSLAVATQGVNAADIASFPSSAMQPDGIVSIASPFDFATTLERVQDAIASQDDTVSFGSVDFQARAAEIGVTLAPATMILFGGPAPGAKAMSAAPTLGLDGFCQKFLIWQADNQQVYLSFNNLLALAERQEVKKSIALRVIDFRLNKVFRTALEE